MKPIDELMTWPMPKNEVLLYALLLLRECKTREDVTAKVYNNPMLQSWGYANAVKEAFENLPSMLHTLTAIYGEEKGG